MSDWVMLTRDDPDKTRQLVNLANAREMIPQPAGETLIRFDDEHALGVKESLDQIMKAETNRK